VTKINRKGFGHACWPPLPACSLNQTFADSGIPLDSDRSESALGANDDIRTCAVDYGFDLCLLGLGHSELVKRLLEIIEKGFPLCRRDHEISVRLLHGATRVLLGSAGSPAEHFRNEVFEACRGNAMMGFVYPRVRIQAGIDHDTVDKIIDNGGDAVDTAKALVKAGRILSHYRPSSFEGT
jgi:hypothetical protein